MINSRVIFLMRVETKATVRVSENSAQARDKLVISFVSEDPLVLVKQTHYQHSM